MQIQKSYVGMVPRSPLNFPPAGLLNNDQEWGIHSFWAPPDSSRIICHLHSSLVAVPAVAIGATRGWPVSFTWYLLAEIDTAWGQTPSSGFAASTTALSSTCEADLWVVDLSLTGEFCVVSEQEAVIQIDVILLETSHPLLECTPQNPPPPPGHRGDLATLNKDTYDKITNWDYTDLTHNLKKSDEYSACRILRLPWGGYWLKIWRSLHFLCPQLRISLNIQMMNSVITTNNSC